MVEDLDLKAELEEVTKSKTRFLSGQTGRKFLKAVTGNPSDLYFVQDCRTGYFDPNSHGACRYHTGYWPRNMTALLGNENVWPRPSAVGHQHQRRGSSEKGRCSGPLAMLVQQGLPPLGGMEPRLEFCSSFAGVGVPDPAI